MKRLINNIDCVRIELDDLNQTYYLPRATSFNGRFIDSIFFYAPNGTGQSDFQTGKPLLSLYDLQASLNLRNSEQNDILQNFPLEYNATGKFYTIASISSYVDWENSYLRVNTPTSGILLMYVVFANTADENDAVTTRRAIEVASGANTPLKPLINSAWFEKVKHITICTPTKQNAYGFLTLVTTDGRVFDYLPYSLFWERKNRRLLSKKDKFVFDNLVIDWQKSHIYNSAIETIKLIFEL